MPAPRKYTTDELRAHLDGTHPLGGRRPAVPATVEQLGDSASNVRRVLLEVFNGTLDGGARREWAESTAREFLGWDDNSIIRATASRLRAGPTAARFTIDGQPLHRLDPRLKIGLGPAKRKVGRRKHGGPASP